MTTDDNDLHAEGIDEPPEEATDVPASALAGAPDPEHPNRRPPAQAAETA